MIRYYATIAFRRFKKDKFFSVLNITGLTVGVTCFILLMLYVNYELSFDQFHEKGDTIYVLAEKIKTRNGKLATERYRAGHALMFKEQIPELQHMTQVNIVNFDNLITIGDRQFYEEKVFTADNLFFDIFDFPILSGSPGLDAPGNAVISQHLADKYFEGQDPIGQELEIRDEGTFLVTAVVGNAPGNSHIQYEILISNHGMLEQARTEIGDGGGQISHNYVLFPDGTDIEKVNDKIADLLMKILPEESHSKNEEGQIRRDYYFLPYTDIHLKSGFEWTFFPVSDMTYVLIFGSIAVLILVIACLNYINLVTAKSAKKIKEIGLRKVMGANQRQLRRQVLAEALTFSAVSVIIAFALAERLLPYFNRLVERDLSLSYLSLEFVLFVIVLSLVLGLFSGLYPAIRLSVFSPVQALTGHTRIKEKKGLRRGLVFFQFFVAQALIVGTLIIQSQLSYVQNKDLGYDREHALFIDTYDDLEEQAGVFKNELQAIPGVSSVAFSDGVFQKNSIVFMQGKEIEGFEGPPDDYLISDYFTIDANFLKTLEMPVVKGDMPLAGRQEEQPGLYINEACQKKLGWDDPIGRKIDLWGQKWQILGVVKDFNNESLKASVKPAMLAVADKPMRYVSLRIGPEGIKETMGAITSLWGNLVDDRPLQYQFYDEYYDLQYKSEMRLGKIFNVFSSLAIVISILGLVGLIAFSAEQRLKEFSIRKVLGARVLQLVLLLYREFFWLIVGAFVLASPIAWYGLNDWLNAFVYRIDLTPFTFVLALVITLAVASLVVLQVSGKVSKVNPAEVLKNE